MSLLLATSGDIASGVVEAEGVDFDGVTDKLTGSIPPIPDGKSFTLSFWIYIPIQTETAPDIVTSGKFEIDMYDRLRLYISGDSGQIISSVHTNFGEPVIQNTWHNYLISIDVASAATRHVFLDDRDVTSEFDWAIYVNALIDFSFTSWTVMNKLKGRASNIFFDTTYRDLSIEANRRLFITADGKPADGLGLVDKYYIHALHSDTIIQDIEYSSDGMKMFILYGTTIVQYSLVEAYDTRTAIYEKTLVLTDGFSTKSRFAFSDNGNHVYLYKDAAPSAVIQYTLSSSFDIKTATYDGFTNLSYASCKGLEISSNGMYLYQCLSTSSQITRYTLNTPYNILGGLSGVQSITTSGTVSSFGGIRISSDGKYLYSMNLYQSTYTQVYVSVFGTPFDITTLSVGSYLSNKLYGLASTARGLCVSPNNTKIFILTYNDIYSIINIPTSYYNSFSYDILGEASNTPTAPILYLPMRDASTAHINEGTGGNFTLNGTLDTASRGANQDNCKASYFDGVADYLSRTSLTGVADGKQFTFSCNYHPYITASGLEPLISFNAADLSVRFRIAYNVSGQTLNIVSANSDTTYNLSLSVSGFIKLGIDTHISISVDLSNSQNCSLLINGLLVTPTFSLYDNSNIVFTQSSMFNIARDNTSYTKGDIGELYFDTKYIDLATSNPFWDSVAKRPKPVRKVISDTGITPLIAMPLDASNAGKNYGTGGDFSANSAPYVGARGGSEFWARSAFTKTSVGYLEKSVSKSYYENLSFVVSVRSQGADNYCCSFLDIARNNLGYFYIDQPNNGNFVLALFGNATSSNNIFLVSDALTYTATTWVTIMCSINMTTKTTKLYINNIAQPSATFNGSLPSITLGDTIKLGVTTSANPTEGNIALSYFTTDYIDFSQEANRLKFIDGLGYPKDLKAQIDAGVIPKPLIYLPFSDPINLGKNLGTGGDFSVVGSVVPSSDVLG